MTDRIDPSAFLKKGGSIALGAQPIADVVQMYIAPSGFDAALITASSDTLPAFYPI